MLSFKINKESLNALSLKLANFEKKVRNKIVRKGMKNWARETEQAIKSNITWKETTIQKHIAHKIKTKKGKVWCGVGGKSGVKVNHGLGNQFWAASKIRWYNDGFRPWAKGVKPNRKGKDWRRNLKGNVGGVIYNTKFIDRAYEQQRSRVVHHIENSIREAIGEA